MFIIEIIFFLAILGILCFYLHKDNERAKARQQVYLQSLQSLSQSLEEIQDDFRNFVCEYVKSKP